MKSVLSTVFLFCVLVAVCVAVCTNIVSSMQEFVARFRANREYWLLFMCTS